MSSYLVKDAYIYLKEEKKPIELSCVRFSRRGQASKARLSSPPGWQAIQATVSYLSPLPV